MLLGRSSGISDEQMAHLEDPLPPPQLFSPREATIVRYARTLARMEPIDDELYGDLERHFSTREIVELCFIVGSAGLVNRFHATFRTDVDTDTLEQLGTSCPVPLPPVPRD